MEFVSDISFTVLSIEFFNMARYMGMQGFGMDKMKNTIMCVWGWTYWISLKKISMII